MFTITCPVYAVDILVIEFIVDLTHHVVVDIFAFERRLTVVGGIELDIFGRTLGKVNLLHA